MRWRSHALVWMLGLLLALLLSVAAGVAAGWQVQIGAGATTRTCGSVVDVVSGRIGWRQWWAADVAETDQAARLVRTQGCPDAENRRLVLVGGLLLAAVTAGGTALVVRHVLAGESDTPSGRTADVDRLRSLGRRVALLAAVMLVAGVVAIATLVANPDATVFVYVGRPTVALLGVLALVPALGLLVVGRALDLLGRSLAARGSGDEPS